jgi:hypothetical protein
MPPSSRVLVALPVMGKVSGLLPAVPPGAVGAIEADGVGASVLVEGTVGVAEGVVEGVVEGVGVVLGVG